MFSDAPRDVVRMIWYSQAAYWCTLALAVWSYAVMPPGATQTAFILSPIVPALLAVAVSYWAYHACDEYFRLRILRSVAITALTVAFCTLGYFFLEFFGFPRLSLLWVNVLGWSVFNGQMLYLITRSR